MDMINESASSIIIDDNIIDAGDTPSRITFAINPQLQKDMVSSPISHHKHIQMQKTP